VVQEIDLGDVEQLDGVIEGGHESVVDLAVVLVSRAPNKVKIPEKDPRAQDQRREVQGTCEEGQGA
jgi:hypothetical protein